MTSRELAPLVPGTLYLVATPIGNLEDITLRALRMLRDCTLIAAEDTRHITLLLRHYDLKKTVLSCHQFNEAKRADNLIHRLQRGETVALVSDAGSPGISDPGTRIVCAALHAGLRVESVPGPCALVAALTASGLPTHEFHFLGFLPVKPGARRRKLEEALHRGGTLVVYESPHRLERLLETLSELVPTHQVVLARELTKRFEEYRRGTATELRQTLRDRPVKGEFVVLVHPPLPTRQVQS